MILDSDIKVASAWMINNTYAHDDIIIGDGPRRTIWAEPPKKPRSRDDHVCLALGPWDSSNHYLRLRNVIVRPEQETDGTTWDGVIARGVLEGSGFVVHGFFGDATKKVESFGLRITNNDPIGPAYGHGGNQLSRFYITTDRPGTYCTGLCIATKRHLGARLLVSVAEKFQINLHYGNWAGLTGANDVVFRDGHVTGVVHGYNNDTGPSDNILVENVTFRNVQTGVRLASSVDAPKTNQIFYKCTFMFEPEVTARGIELYDEDNSGSYENIVFEKCRFLKSRLSSAYKYTTNSTHLRVEPTFINCYFADESEWEVYQKRS